MLPGELLALYLVAYAIGRSLLELVRLDSRAVPFLGLETGLAVATLVSLLVALLAQDTFDPNPDARRFSTCSVDGAFPVVR